MFDEKTLEVLSARYNLKCNVFYNSIYVNSAYRNWVCVYEEGIYRLKHMNIADIKHKNHMHKEIFYTLDKVFEYIYVHDTETILDRDKEIRVKYENLFNQIR